MTEQAGGKEKKEDCTYIKIKQFQTFQGSLKKMAVYTITYICRESSVPVVTP